MKRAPRRPLSRRQAFAAGVARLRGERGWSQAELASIMRHAMQFSWTRTAVSNIESGQRAPTPDEELALLQVFRVGIAELLGDGEIWTAWGAPYVPGGEAIAGMYAGTVKRGELEGGLPGPSSADVEAAAHAASRLGITYARLQVSCRRRYGRGFIQERERRVAEAVERRGGCVARRSLQALRAAAAKQIVSEIGRKGSRE